MKQHTAEQIRQKIERYCAYQERCHQEVRDKLYSLGASSNEVEETISALIVDGYLNEERFAKAFAGGKFRMKKWGRLRIVNELEKKGVSKNCIKSGLKEISDEDYLSTLEKLLAAKIALTVEDNLYVKRDKISSYAMQRGYEPDIIWKILRQLLPDK